VCYYSPELLKDKAVQLKMGDYDTLSDTNKMKAIETIEQKYLAYLFLNSLTIILVWAETKTPAL
jgi:hypothetical protein